MLDSPTDFTIGCLRALDRCEQLAKISEMEDGILRRYLTKEHQQANTLVASWMQMFGLQTWQDAVGNQWGRLASDKPDAKRLILGSHLDTVPAAGKYDGILGVMLALEVAQWCVNHHQSLPFHLEIVGFADEEGTRYGTTLIGSKALAGQFNDAWLSIADKDGQAMADALQAFGLDAANVGDATLDASDVLSYWEVHIEQGPVLENENLSLGVVSGISGAKRANIIVQGQAGHAGTTPMNLRQDAVVAGAELISAIESLTLDKTNGEVATVGSITASPGATNVIAGQCRLSLDVRALSDTDRDALIEEILQTADHICEQRKVTIAFHWSHEASAVLCDEQLQRLFAESCKDNGIDYKTLPSGAGHDAMAIAPICPVGMLFIRSPRGLSHHPEESVITEDVTDALTVLVTAVEKYAKQLTTD